MNKLRQKLGIKVEIPKDINNSPKTLTNNEISHIIDNIYISNYKSTLNKEILLKNNFTHIINCAYGSKSFTPSHFDEITYLNIDLKDDGNSNLSNAIVKFINYMKKISEIKNGNILIHCTEGISRSPALVSAYLMWKLNMDSLSAINFVKSKRNYIDINLGFMFQLENLNTHRELFQQIF